VSLHFSDQLIEEFRRGKLSPDALAAFGEHLEGCTECGRRVAGRSGGASDFQAARQALSAAAREDFTHLQFEEMEALVQGRLGDVEGEIAESHLAVCRACAEDVADLRAFRDELAAEPTRPVASPSALPRPAKVGLRERLRALFPSPSFTFSPSYALAAVMLLLAFAAVLYVALRQREEGPREIANQNAPAPAPEVVRSSAPTPAPAPSAAETPTPEVSRPALALDDGNGTVGLDARGELIGLEALAAAERRQVKEALSGGRVEVARVQDRLAGRPGALMGAATEGVPFGLKGPVGIVLRTSRPKLSWEPLKGAGGYTVTVVDESGRVLARSPELKGTAWVVSPALPRGKIYSWQVSARRDGDEVVSPAPPAPEARFKVLDVAQASALERAERDARGSHLALGVLYARAGLLDEAERELGQLRRRNPQSDIARRLLQSVRAQRLSARRRGR
jgi:hypothetical protein